MHPSWRSTFVGRHFSNQYGYGVVDGEKLRSLLPNHVFVEDQVTVHSQVFNKNTLLLNSQQGFRDYFHVTRESLGGNKRMVLEHVVVTLTIKSMKRSNIRVSLVSPNNVVSDLIIPRAADDSAGGFKDHPVMTLAHWYSMQDIVAYF